MFDYENVLEVLWKGMVIGMAALMVATIIVTFGCVAPNGVESGAYRAGRAGAVAFMLTEDVQSPVTRIGVVIARRTLSAMIEGGLPLDMEERIETEVDEQLAKLVPDATPELRTAALNAVRMLRARLRAEIADLTVVDEVGAVLKAFQRGVDDALRDYGYAASDEGIE